MPIMLPTAAEIERMDHRQRIALAKRLPSTRRELADALATLTLHGLDPFPTRRAVTIATARAAATISRSRPLSVGRWGSQLWPVAARASPSTSLT